jgi:hypothetical protein
MCTKLKYDQVIVAGISKGGGALLNNGETLHGLIESIRLYVKTLF